MLYYNLESKRDGFYAIKFYCRDNGIKIDTKKIRSILDYYGHSTDAIRVLRAYKNNCDTNEEVDLDKLKSFEVERTCRIEGYI